MEIDPSKIQDKTHCQPRSAAGSGYRLMIGSIVMTVKLGSALSISGPRRPAPPGR
jgi:hypothetical protein